MTTDPRPTKNTDSANMPADPRKRDTAELDHFVRALSHDMSANFMVLEDSLRRLKRNQVRQPLADLAESFAHVEACLRESKRFLDDLVLLGKTGSVDMEAARVELDPLVREVIFEQRALLDERQIDVVVAEQLPAVWCNEVRVRQIFTNLIRNAARHGCDPHAPRIEVSEATSLDLPDNRFTWFRVYDNGRGIPAAEREEIFLPGKRLAGAHESGTGMGLAIVQKAIAHFGGTIFVDPHGEVGTTMLFSLPNRPVDTSSASPEQHPTHQRAGVRRPHHRRRLGEGRRR